MEMFNPNNRVQSKKHMQIYTRMEIAYTVVDFSAAALFVVGSALFFQESTTYLATWLFLIGSVLFGMKPTIRLCRELAYLRLGDHTDLADRS